MMMVIKMHSNAPDELPSRGLRLRNNGLMKYARMYAEIMAPTKGNTINAESKINPMTTVQNK
jgi:hypothetical protein